MNSMSAIPAPPANLYTGIGSLGSQVTIFWDDPLDPLITGYEIALEIEGKGFGPWLPIPGSNATTRLHTVTDLTECQVYVFKIRAVAGGVKGRESAEAVFIPSRPTLAAPVNLRIVATCRRQVAIAWNDLSNPSITGYEIATDLMNGDGFGPWLPISGSNATTGLYVPCLTQGHGYAFKIRAVAGNVKGEESCEVILVPCEDRS